MVAMNKLEELHSFVKKFSALWAAGSNASLSFESNAGQVFVTFRLGLGDHPSRMSDPNLENKMKKRLSPSKLRRRERRAAERLSARDSMPVDIIGEVVTTAEDRKADAIENIVHVDEVVIEKVVEECTVVDENVGEACKTGNNKCMAVVDEEVVAEKPTVKSRSLWAQASCDPSLIRGVQRNDQDRGPDTMGQILK